ncbi:MAG TPA: 30S ribosomal protein S12 methylthiotransferase RimO [Candidatus Binatia bacterium]|jgi:ribosomal protein S12 methylthiotransferase|nr:30S ribosomal protein S12 methylthiotransferase RimO [Candidatus Binatia bacterium]
MEKTVYMVNLGCPKNLVDGEVMLGLLAQKGYQLSLDPERADVLMVNTCSFINEAKEESIDTILELARYKEHSPAKQLIVTGCLAQRYGQELRNSLPEVDVFVGTGEFVRISEILEQKRALLDSSLTYIGAAHVLPDHTVPRIATTPFYTAYLKVAEGCNHKCAFCIIPKIRGLQESRPISSLTAEAEALAAQGVQELNLIAQDLTAYGRERRDGTTLLALLRALCRVEGIVWIRLLYCYPNYLDEPLLRCIAEEEKICSYLDMPLQHISDRLLRAMRREKSGDGIKRLLDRIRAHVPGVVLRTSFIVGFPGEQEEDFRQLLAFVSEAAIDHVGVFRYSQEEGTVAGSMPDQVLEEVKQERWQRLMERQAQVVRRKNFALLGSEQEVLVCDTDTRGRLWGRTRGQAPEIDGVVFLNHIQAESGQIIPACITGVSGYDLRAKEIAP